MQVNLKAMFAGKREAVELPLRRGPGRPPKVRNKEAETLDPVLEVCNPCRTSHKPTMSCLHGEALADHPR